MKKVRYIEEGLLSVGVRAFLEEDDALEEGALISLSGLLPNLLRMNCSGARIVKQIIINPKKAIVCFPDLHGNKNEVTVKSLVEAATTDTLSGRLNFEGLVLDNSDEKWYLCFEAMNNRDAEQFFECLQKVEKWRLKNKEK